MRGRRAPLVLWAAAAVVPLLAEGVEAATEKDPGRNEVFERAIFQTEVELLKKEDDAPPLLTALVRKFDAELVDYYLKRTTGDQAGEFGDSVDEEDQKGVTALWHAAFAMKPRVVSTLIKHSAEVDVAKKPGGLTPLMVAAMNSDVETLKVLLDEGRADLEKTTRVGASALALAFQSGHTDMASVLLERGAKINLTAPTWRTLSMLMIDSGRDKDDESLQLLRQALQDDEASLALLKKLERQVKASARALAEEEAGDDPDGLSQYADDSEESEEDTDFSKAIAHESATEHEAIAHENATEHEGEQAEL